MSIARPLSKSFVIKSFTVSFIQKRKRGSEPFIHQVTFNSHFFFVLSILKYVLALLLKGFLNLISYLIYSFLIISFISISPSHREILSHVSIVPTSPSFHSVVLLHLLSNISHGDHVLRFSKSVTFSQTFFREDFIIIDSSIW